MCLATLSFGKTCKNTPSRTLPANQDQGGGGGVVSQVTLKVFHFTLKKKKKVLSELTNLTTSIYGFFVRLLSHVSAECCLNA